MPFLRSFAIFGTWAMGSLALAVSMPPQLPSRSIGLGLSTLHVEQPDSNIEQRYRLDLQEYERLFYGFRLHNRLSFAPDKRPRSDAVQVHHHFYEAYCGPQWTGTRLFRYSLGAGPLLLLEQTVINIHFNQSSERAYNRWQLGWLAELQLDYAFNDFWELAVNIGWQARPAVHKQDLSFGVSVLFNRGTMRKDESIRTKALPPPPPLLRGS